MPTSEVLSIDFFSSVLHPFFLKRSLQFSNAGGKASDKLHTRPQYGVVVHMQETGVSAATLLSPAAQSGGLHRLVALGWGEGECRTP